jgi:hypothetical protein
MLYITEKLSSDDDINDLTGDDNDLFRSPPFHPFGGTFVADSRLFYFLNRHIRGKFQIKTGFSVE